MVVGKTAPPFQIKAQHCDTNEPRHDGTLTTTVRVWCYAHYRMLATSCSATSQKPSKPLSEHRILGMPRWSSL